MSDRTAKFPGTVVMVGLLVLAAAPAAAQAWRVEAGGTLATVAGVEERTGASVDLNVSCRLGGLRIFFVMDLPVVSERQPISTTMISDSGSRQSVAWDCEPVGWGVMCTVRSRYVPAVEDVLVRGTRVRFGIGRSTGVYLRFSLRGSARAISSVRRRC